MLDAAREALSFTQGKSRSALEEDRQLTFALVYCIEIIGEAAARVSEPTRLRLSEIPWPIIVGTRNRLIHAYHDVDLGIIWETVTQDLPRLVEQLEQALRD